MVNARIAVARSHGTGVLPGRSIQRDYLSAAYSDFIFAIVAEELGACRMFIGHRPLPMATLSLWTHRRTI